MAEKNQKKNKIFWHVKFYEIQSSASLNFIETQPCQFIYVLPVVAELGSCSWGQIACKT